MGEDAEGAITKMTQIAPVSIAALPQYAAAAGLSDAGARQAGSAVPATERHTCHDRTTR